MQFSVKWQMFVDFMLIFGMSVLGILIISLLKISKQLSKRMLVVFFINSFFFLLYYYAFTHQSHFLGSIAILLGNGSGYLLGPFLLFYLKSLVLSRERILPSLYNHLIPFFLIWVFISLPVSISMITDYFTIYAKQYAVMADYLNLIENSYFLFYIILALNQLIIIKRHIKEYYSRLDEKDLFWFEYFIYGLIFIVIMDSICSFYELIFPRLSWNIGIIISFSLVVLYSYLGYKGIFQSKILLPTYFDSVGDKENRKKLKPINRPETNQLDRLSEIEVKEFKEKLYNVLVNQKIYLSDSVSLSDLAGAIGISDKKLSELLNQHLKISFYNLINNFRVSEAKKKIESQENDKYTLLGIAYDSGFQSKASFNRIFKRKTGMTPSMYRKKTHISNNMIR